MNIDQYLLVSKIYNHLMRSVDYKDWAKYIIDICIKNNSKFNSLLELSCGTCTLSKYLKESFNETVVSDYSLSMLKECRTDSTLKICCDMTCLPFKNKFDVIISAFDSVNYLTTDNKIRNLFRSIKSTLMPDGIFTFDVSLEKNSLKHVKHLNRKGVFDKIKYSQKSIYEKSERMHYNLFKLKLRNGEIVEELHTQKIYAFEDYFNFISEFDLYVSDCYNAFSFNDADEDSERVQFIVKNIK